MTIWILVVGVLGVTKSRVQRVLVLSSILGASRDGINDTKCKGVNNTLQSPQYGSNRLSERSETQEAVFANHSLQKFLVNLHKLFPF